MRFLREIWWGSARIIYIQTHNYTSDHNVPSIIQKRVLLLGPPTRKKGLGFLGGKGKCAFYVKFGGAVPGLYRHITIHPTIMYHQSFRKGSFFWGLLPGERGLVFLGGKGKCAFYVKFGGAVPGLYIYRHITIHPTIMYHQSFRKGSFFWGLLPGERGLVFLGGKGKCAFYVKFGGAVPGLYIYRH